MPRHSRPLSHPKASVVRRLAPHNSNAQLKKSGQTAKPAPLATWGRLFSRTGTNRQQGSCGQRGDRKGGQRNGPPFAGTSGEEDMRQPKCTPLEKPRTPLFQLTS